MAIQIPTQADLDALKAQLTAFQSQIDAAVIAATTTGGDLLQAGGETSMARVGPVTNFAPAANNTHHTYFTARRTEMVGTLYVIHRNTAAVGTTDARFGIYEHDLATNQLTRVAITTNDTTLFNTGFKSATLPFTPFQKVAGRRYAIAMRITATTMPNFWGRQAEPGGNTQPYLNGYSFGTDLPTGLAAPTGISGATSNIYYELRP